MFVWKKYVYEVYKERSFTKAAQNLYISQPSLSARIKKIEEIIGEPLFDRSTTPLQLTEVGKVYIEAAEEITQIEQRVENYINDLAGLKTGNLAVGASTLFAIIAATEREVLIFARSSMSCVIAPQSVPYGIFTHVYPSTSRQYVIII